MNTVPSTVVALDSMSAVLRTPNMLPKPAPAPPKVPARPPPLLDCIKTTTVSNIATNNSKITKKVYKFSPLFCVKFTCQTPEMQLHLSLRFIRPNERAEIGFVVEIVEVLVTLKKIHN